MKWLKALGISSAVMAALLTFASGSSAHVGLESSSPAAGSTLTTSPASVVLTFDGEIQKIAGKYSLEVTGAGGSDVTSGAATVSGDGTHLSRSLQADLPAGTYTIVWSNTSADDGDAEEGEFTFAVGSAPVAQPTPVEDHHDDEAGHDDEAAHDDGVAAPTTGLIVVVLAPVADSGVSGRVEIMPVDGGAKAQVGVYVSGIEPGSSHMNHIHMESGCDVTTPGPHAADLTDIDSPGTSYGSSLTTIDVPFSVIANGTHTIRVHAGATGGDKATIACGEIPAQPEGHSEQVQLPSAGHGTSAPFALGAATILLLVAGLSSVGVGATLAPIARRSSK